MSEVEEYIKTLVESPSSLDISDEEKKRYKFEGPEKYILSKITSNKYKAKAIPQSLKEKIIEILRNAILASKPIHFSVPFGGFKKWQFPSYPNVDWAEVFNIIHLRNFAIEIAKLYEPGVIIQWVSDEIFISRMNNMAQKDIDLYNAQFYQLIAQVQQYCPANVMLRYTKIRDEISQSEILKRFDRGILELKKNWSKLPAEEQKNRIAKSKRNFLFAENPENLASSDVQSMLFESTMVHDAFIFSDWEKGVSWAFRPDMIPIGFRYTGEWGINLTSCPTSTVQFWVGYGVLEKVGSKLRPKILTYTQYEAIKSQLSYTKVKTIFSTHLLQIGITYN